MKFKQVATTNEWRERSVDRAETHTNNFFFSSECKLNIYKEDLSFMGNVHKKRSRLQEETQKLFKSFDLECNKKLIPPKILKPWRLVLHSTTMEEDFESAMYTISPRYL